MKQITVGNLKRISKRKAEKLYKEKKIIYICGCNINPLNAFGFTCMLNAFGRDFNAICNEWEHLYSGVAFGAYPAFYIEV